MFMASRNPRGSKAKLGPNALKTTIVLVVLAAQALWATGTAPTSPRLTLVASLPLPPDPFFVTTYGSLAIIGNASIEGDIYLVDISDPARPHQIGTVKARPKSAATFPHAMRIGARDVLVNNYQGEPGGANGLELVDITDPGRPQVLSFFDVGGDGVHEMDVTQLPDGRALALLAVPNRELSGPRIDGKRIGDLMIVDISDPMKPNLVGEWGVIDHFGMPFFEAAHRGWNPSVFGHSVWAYPGGTRALLSYKDAGVFILDIRDPRNLNLVGHTVYPDGAEGEASFAIRQGNILIQGDEDYFTFEVSLMGRDFGKWPAVEPRFTEKAVYDLPGHKFFGELVHIGRGCPGDPYLAGVAGKIALVERSAACRMDHQIARAQLEGAVAAIIYNAAAASGLPNAGENVFAMRGSRTVAIPDASGRPTSVAINIPAVGVQRGAVVLPDGKMRAQATVAAQVDGWGFLRFYRIDRPGGPSPIGSFLPEHMTPARLLASRTPLARVNSNRNVHNPVARGNLVFAPWREDGLRVIENGPGGVPREVASWTGQGAPAGAKGSVWSVALHRNVILAVDPEFGLYILKEGP